MKGGLGWAAMAAVLLGGALGSAPARGNVRHFSYTYESGVLGKGEKEVELWTTWRSGRNAFYSRFEHRLEYEMGLSDRLMTALYLNWRKTTTDAGSSTEFRGLSTEWKMKFSDPTADALGLAGYGELYLDTNQTKIEAKLIADKAFGSLRAAYNAVLEVVAVPEGGKLRSHEVEAVHVGGLYAGMAPSWGLGLEARAFTLYEDGDREFTAYFAGPVLHLSRGEFWATLTALSQVSASSSAPAALTDGLVLGDLERTNIRLLVSLPL